MNSRGLVFAALLVVGACSKPQPETSAPASAPAAAAQPMGTTVTGAGATTPLPTSPAEGTADDEHGGGAPQAMTPEMAMAMRDGGMGHAMGDHPMPAGMTMRDGGMGHGMPGRSAPAHPMPAGMTMPANP